MVVKRFEDLYIWQQAKTLVLDIYRLMGNCSDYGFRDQIQRAAVSIMNNIAEGFDSGYNAKFMHFVNVANGSCSEVRSMLYLCEELGYCNSSDREQLQKYISQISAGIVKLREVLKNNTGS